MRRLSPPTFLAIAAIAGAHGGANRIWSVSAPYGGEAAAYSPDGRYVAERRTGGFVVWDRTTGGRVAVLPTGLPGARAAFTPDSGEVAVVSGAPGADAFVRLYSAGTGAFVRSARVRAPGGLGIVFSADGTRVHVGGRSYAWPNPGSSLTSPLRPGDAAPNRWSPDGRWFLTDALRGADGRVRFTPAGRDPLFSGGFVVSFAADSVVAQRPADGTVAWTFALRGATFRSLGAAGDLVLVGARYGVNEWVYGLDPATGLPVLRDRAPAAVSAIAGDGRGDDVLLTAGLGYAARYDRAADRSWRTVAVAPPVARLDALTEGRIAATSPGAPGLAFDLAGAPLALRFAPGVVPAADGLTGVLGRDLLDLRNDRALASAPAALGPSEVVSGRVVSGGVAVRRRDGAALNLLLDLPGETLLNRSEDGRTFFVRSGSAVVARDPNGVARGAGLTVPTGTRTVAALGDEGSVAAVLAIPDLRFVRTGGSVRRHLGSASAEATFALNANGRLAVVQARDAAGRALGPLVVVRTRDGAELVELDEPGADGLPKPATLAATFAGPGVFARATADGRIERYAFRNGVDRAGVTFLGDGRASGTVRLSEPAPAGGLRVRLTYAGVLSGPETALVPEGTDAVDVPLTVAAVTASSAAAFTAGAGHHDVATWTGRFDAPRLVGLVGPSVVFLGGEVWVNATLGTPALPGGTVVVLSATNSVARTQSFRVPEGETRLRFRYQTLARNPVPATAQVKGWVLSDRNTVFWSFACR